MICSAAVGLLVGVWAASEYAKNLSASAVEIPGIGKLHRIALPIGVTRFEDVRSIEIEVSEADDYVRVYFNNYLAINNDYPGREVLFSTTWGQRGDKAWKPALTAGTRIHRKADLLGRRNATISLRRGWNHIVVELENGADGYCVVQPRIFVNGTPVGGLPPVLPESAEDALKFVASRRGTESATAELLDGNSLRNALCARAVYQFQVQ